MSDARPRPLGVGPERAGPADLPQLVAAAYVTRRTAVPSTSTGALRLVHDATQCNKHAPCAFFVVAYLSANFCSASRAPRARAHLRRVRTLRTRCARIDARVDARAPDCIAN